MYCLFYFFLHFIELKIGTNQHTIIKNHRGHFSFLSWFGFCLLGCGSSVKYYEKAVMKVNLCLPYFHHSLALIVNDVCQQSFSLNHWIFSWFHAKAKQIKTRSEFDMPRDLRWLVKTWINIILQQSLSLLSCSANCSLHINTQVPTIISHVHERVYPQTDAKPEFNYFFYFTLLVSVAFSICKQVMGFMLVAFCEFNQTFKKILKREWCHGKYPKQSTLPYMSL